MTALVVDAEGRLTYMGIDGQRRVIVGDQDLLDRLQSLREQTDDTTFEGGWGSELDRWELHQRAIVHLCFPDHGLRFPETFHATADDQRHRPNTTRSRVIRSCFPAPYG